MFLYAHIENYGVYYVILVTRNVQRAAGEVQQASMITNLIQPGHSVAADLPRNNKKWWPFDELKKKIVCYLTWSNLTQSLSNLDSMIMGTISCTSLITSQIVQVLEKLCFMVKTWQNLFVPYVTYQFFVQSLPNFKTLLNGISDLRSITSLIVPGTQVMAFHFEKKMHYQINPY